jgi:hypothetical protein
MANLLTNVLESIMNVININNLLLLQSALQPLVGFGLIYDS